MRKLPEELRKVVIQLHELRLNNSIFGRSQREESIVNLLKQLEVANIPGTMPCVARFLVSSSPNLRSVSIETLGKMISNVAPYDLIDLSDQVAWSYEWHVDDKWERLKPRDVAGLAGSPGNAGYSGVLGILSFHRNGYVRHEAVRCLSMISDGSELPFLLIRQNDWVQPVAVDAQQAVNQRINDNYVQIFVRCLRLTLHLESLKRYDHGNAVRKIIDLLCLPKHDELLHSVISSSDRKVRQQVTRHVFEIPGEHQLRILDYGINSSDPLIRQRCCKHLSLIADSNLFANVVDKLLQDPFMPVRREALEQKSKRFPEQAEQVWRTALFDSSRSIRELSWFMLREFDIDRAKIAYYFGNQDQAFGHVDPRNFFVRFYHQDWLDRLHEEANRSSEIFVQHFKNTSQEFPDLPVWIATEIMSFGALSRMLKGMVRSDQKAIARSFGLQSTNLEDWMHHSLYIRNRCAHHSRLWDRTWPISPSVPAGKAWKPPLLRSNRRVFVTLLLLRYWLKRIPAADSFANEWKKRVETHMQRLPTSPNALARLGMTPDWSLHPVWW